MNPISYFLKIVWEMYVLHEFMKKKMIRDGCKINYWRNVKYLNK